MCKEVYKIIFTILSLLFICINAYAKNYEFNNLVIFGDSLSDTGNISYNTPEGIINSKIVAGNNKIYAEYLSKIFTGKTILPAIYGGTNYAISNAVVNGDFYPDNVLYDIKNTAINTQFNKYLSTHKIIPNDLYILWGGGNDLGASIINVVIDSISFNTAYTVPNFIINIINFIGNVLYDDWEHAGTYLKYDPITGANSSFANFYITDMAKTLINKGAKYVIVPNLFDAGTAPRFIFPEVMLSIVAQSILDTNPNNKNLSIQKILLPFGLNKLIYNTINVILAIESQIYFNHLNKKNNIPLTGQSGRQFILNNLHHRYSKLGLGSLAVKLADLFSLTTRNFNYFLDQQLSQLDNKIVYIDIYSLFNEIIDNPKFYGFDDIILPTCSAVFLATDNACKNQLSGIYHPEKTYLFSDGVHPSPLMHLIFAQYMESIFNAPFKFSAIPQQLITDNNNSQDYLLNQLDNFNPSNDNKTFSFVSFGGNLSKFANYYDSKLTSSNNLNVGIAFALDNNLIFGSMLNASFGKLHPFDSFKYSFNSQLINLFSKYYFNNNFSVITNFNIGRLNASDISRIINLGKANFIQKSNTHAKSLGFNISLHYNLLLNNNFNISPYISFNLHNYKTDPFSEYSNNTTAMKFYKSSTTDKNIKLALKITKQFNPKNISFFDLGINSPIDNHPIKIKSSLKNVKSSFIRDIYFNYKSSFNLALGLNHKFNNSSLFHLSINYKFNSSNLNQLHYSLGFNAKF